MSDRAVVIGSGFGGLACAVRLQAAGVEVTLVEKREQLGGRAYQLQDSGYTFDMGPSLITAPEILDSVFRAGGRRFTEYVDLVPLDPYYRIYFHDDSHIDYVGDVERMREQMARFNKKDAANLDRFLNTVRPIYDSVIGDRLGLQAVRYDRIDAPLHATCAEAAGVPSRHDLREPVFQGLPASVHLLVPSALRRGKSVSNSVDLPHDPVS